VEEGWTLNLIFDFDGTLASLPIDWKKLRAKVSKLYGKLNQNETIFMWIHERKKKGLEVAHVLRLIEEAEEKAVDKLYYSGEVLEVLRQLKNKGARLAVVSMQSERTLRRALNLMGIENIFDHIVGREQSLQREEQLLKVLSRWKVRPQEAVFLTDRADDIDLGRKLGLKAYRAKVLDGSIITVLRELERKAG